MLREREMHVERVSDCRGARTSRVQRETYSDDSARIRLDPRDRVTEGREERLPTRSIRFRLQTSSFVILKRRQASHSDVVATTVLENLLCCLLTVADKVHAAPSLIPHSRRENEVHGLLRSNHDSVCVCGRERERGQGIVTAERFRKGYSTAESSPRVGSFGVGLERTLQRACAREVLFNNQTKGIKIDCAGEWPTSQLVSRTSKRY